jgi:hypothetical protein
MNKEIFSNLYQATFDKSLPFWSQETNWQKNSDLDIILYSFETELIESKADIELLQTRAKLFVEDLIRLRSKSSELIPISEFLQFYSSCLIIKFLLGRKTLNYVYDWLCNSISDSTGTTIERDYFPYRVDGFVTSDKSYIKEHFEQPFLLWTVGLFYYCRSIGGLNELATLYLSNYFSILQTIVRQNDYSIELINAISQLSSWSEQHKKTEYIKDCCQMLYSIYENTKSPEFKKQIAFSFSCMKNNYTRLTKREWCNCVLDEYSTLLIGHEYLQIVLNKYDSDLQTIIKNFDRILDGINIYHTFLDKLSGTGIYMKYELAKIYSLLSNCILRLCINGRIDLVNQLIGHYFKIPSSELIDPDNFYIIPNDMNGVVYAFQDVVIRQNSDVFTNIPKLTEISNKFFGTANSINDLIEFKIDAPDRIGVPDYSLGNEFCTAILKHIDFKNILFHKNIHDVKGVSIYYGNQLPIQAIITRETGITFPLVQSFYKPYKIRGLKKVFIWQGQTNLSETECIGLKEIFEKKGIEVTLLVAENSTKEEFLSHYNNSLYDIVWISSHGEFDHYMPHNSHLNLGNTITVNMEDLAQYKPEISLRRLIVLDACDGATTALFNSPASIGIGATIVKASQSLISHSWPVSDYSGLVLSIILAIYLSNNYSYKEAHAATVLLFLKGKESIIDFVQKHCTDEDVLERITNTTIDFGNYYFWGSLTYVE